MYRTLAAMLAALPCALLPCAILPCVGVAQAQDISQTVVPSASPLTLDQAIATAGGVAPAAEAAQAGVEAARAARTIAGLRPNPEVQTQVENVAGTGQYRDFDSAETTVNIAVPIELGGKRSARIAAADAQSDRARLLAAITQADIRLQVTQLYIDAVAAERRLATAKDQARIAADVHRAAQIRVQAGRASPIEEQRADVARLYAEANVERTLRLAQAARDNLARRIGQTTVGALNPAALDLLPRSYGPESPVSASGTLTLAAADADLAIADAGVRLARSERMPDLNVGPGVRRLSQTGDTALILSVSMPIPLFNAGRAGVAQARAEQSRSQANKRITALDVEQAITTARAEAANALITARMASGPALLAAQEAERIARIGYREGKFGQLDLLDAERTLAETRITAIDALAAYQNARAQLERLTAPAPQQGN